MSARLGQQLSPFQRRRLPLKLTLPGGISVHLDSLKSSNFDSAFSLVSEAARRGDNVGIDEYPTPAHFADLVSNSDVALAVTSSQDSGHIQSTSALKSLLILSPCRYARSINPTLCTAVIITNEELSSRSSVRGLTAAAVQIASLLPRRYTACVADVFVSCVDRLLALRDEDFLITACIPHAGNPGTSTRYVANYILYKELNDVSADDRRLTWTQSDQPACAEHSSFIPVTPNNDEQLLFDESRHVNPTMLSYMPVNSDRINLRMADGTALTVREMRVSEIDAFYVATRDAMASGTGYGVDEIPDKEYFVRNYVHNFYNVVFELPPTGQLVAYANTGPSPFQRSTRCLLMDGNMIVSREFRGKRWYPELLNFIFETCNKTNLFCGGQGDTAMGNLATMLTPMHLGWTPNGILPKGINIRDRGWVDLFMYYWPMTSQSKL